MAGTTLSHGVYVGYDGEPCAFRTKRSQVFENWFDPPSRRPGSLRQESITAAKEVRESTDKELVVLYSGGMDSEWILESFACAGIPVTPLIVRYGGLNDNDLYWANRYCERRALIPLYYDIDLRAWYGSEEQRELAWNAQTIELAYTTQFKAMLELDNGQRAYITGYDEPGMLAEDNHPGGRRWCLMYHERHYSVPKLFQYYGLSGVPNWGRYSPELFGAYVMTPTWQMLAANLYNPLIWVAELIKVPLFRSAFPFMEARPKQTGFEASLDFIITGAKDWQDSVVAKLGYKWNQEWRRDILDVWRDLGMGAGRG
jgi:hypothetical protein